MKKFFDETWPSDHNGIEALTELVIKRTAWFEFALDNVFDLNLEPIVKAVKQHLLPDEMEQHFIFYSTDVHPDAIHDKVRFSVMIQYLENKFYVHINVRDLDFSINFQYFRNLEFELERLLNA
ncbi:MAG: hypothetical protein ACRCST_11465 [Turicibacter sp.]